MNTFVRGPMRNEGGGLLSAEIRLPDIYGIFDFVVKFREPGFQSIDQKFPITINPIRNGILDVRIKMNSRFMIPKKLRYVRQIYPMCFPILFICLFNDDWCILDWIRCFIS